MVSPNSSIHKWSVVPIENDNIDADGGTIYVNWQEGQEPSSVNNSSRQVMARVAEQLLDVASLPVATFSSGAGTDTYTVQISSDPAQLYDNMFFGFIPDTTNVQPCALVVQGAITNTFTAKNLRAVGNNVGTNIPSGGLRANVPVLCTYDASADEFVIYNNAATVAKEVVNESLTATINNLTPAGSIFAWAAPISDTVDPPAGYLVCDGSVYAQAEYPDLYAVIGDAYNIGGETASQFRVPNYQGYFMRGARTNKSGSQATVDPDIGSRTPLTGQWPGAVTPVVDDPGSTQSDEVTSHTHTISVTVDSGGEHNHTFQAGTQTWLWASAVGGAFGSNFSAPITPTSRSATENGGLHNHTASGSATNTGGSETRAINQYVHWIIFAKPSDALIEQQALYNLPYQFEADITSDLTPPAGKFYRNTTDNTYLFSYTGQKGQDYEETWKSWASIGTANPVGILYISVVGAPEAFDHKEINTFTAVDGFGYMKLSFNPATGGQGNWPPMQNAQCGVDFTPVAAGTVGASGANPGKQYSYSTAGAGFPGSGSLSFGGVWPSAGPATIYIDKFDQQGNDLSGTLALWGTSTNPAHKAHVRVINVANRGNFAEVHLTGAGTDQTTHWEFPVQVESIGTSMSGGETLTVLQSRTGDSQTGAIEEGWHTMWIPASYMTASATGGASHATNEYVGTNTINVQALHFAPNQDDEATFFMGMPNSWQPSFGLRFQPVWTGRDNPGGATNGVTWEFNGLAFSDTDDIDVAWGGGQVTVADTYDVSFKMQKNSTPSSPMSLGNTPVKEDVMLIRVRRLGSSDDWLGTAQLIGVNVYHYIDEPTDL